MPDSTPDLDKARDAAHTHLDRNPGGSCDIARLILEQRAEEAERLDRVDSDYGIVLRIKQRERAADLRRQAGGEK